jgi:D-glycero-alpha-D-manno-heptose-7-phosphate kinase
MIVSKTPLRVSFVGGGTDIPAWYESGHPGMVVSAAVNLFIHVCVGQHWIPNKTRVSYSRTETVSNLDYMEHELVRESMRHIGFDGGLEITTIADVPGHGTGLGSSSAVTVGLVNAISRMKDRALGPRVLAEESAYIEMVRCNKRIGKQDHYSASFGGVNFIRFNPRGTVDIEPLQLSQKTQESLNSKFRLYHTGLARNSGHILKDQIENYKTRKARSELFKLSNLAVQAREALLAGSMDEFAYIVIEGWERKKAIYPGVSTPEIDSMYETAIQHGAVGGKLCGAGGGGFLLLYIPNEDVGESVFQSLGLRELRVRYGAKGSEIFNV